MNNAIIFLSIFILFLSLMLIFKVDFSYSLDNNKIMIIVYLYNFKILTLNISIIGLTYQINNSKKLKTLKLILSKEEKYLLKQIKHSIVDKLYYDNITFSSELGLINASDTAMSVGLLNFICQIINGIIYSKNKDTDFYYINIPNFEYLQLNFQASVKVYFTIFDFVFAIIMSFYKRGKYAKERKKG